MTMSIANATVSYSTLVNDLQNDGYTLITPPSNYVPQLNLSIYNNAVFELYHKFIAGVDYYYEVYKFPDASSANIAAESDNGKPKCDLKWHNATPNNGEGCWDAGNECHIDVSDPTKPIVICC